MKMFFGFILILLTSMIIFIIYLKNKEENEWRNFSKEHSCQIVSQGNMNVINTIGVDQNGSSVVGIAIVPGKTGYRCNDGKIYYR